MSCELAGPRVRERSSAHPSRAHAARQRQRDALLQIEGEERFEALQRFLAAVHKLTRERRLSRFVFVAEK